MISEENKFTNLITCVDDFTVSHYRELLKKVLLNYKITSYKDINWDQKFILWRHDLDLSLNRGLKLAIIENEEGVKATYFINIHSEFYNINEKSQQDIIRKIISLGHEIAIHFDSSFYQITNENELVKHLNEEVLYLERMFKSRITSFSFHNPSSLELNFENNTYAGLINCYSKRFKESVPYCSDSNGHWRFRRLMDVLSEAKDQCLQVLTHPGWWQDKPMPPRNRVFKSVYGRAEALMKLYDIGIEKGGRVNHRGLMDSIVSLKSIQNNQKNLCIYLYNKGHFQSLYIQLWLICLDFINKICKESLVNSFPNYLNELNKIFDKKVFKYSSYELFEVIYNTSLFDVLKLDESIFQYHQDKVLSMMHNSFILNENGHKEEECIFVIKIIKRLNDDLVLPPISGEWHNIFDKLNS